MKPSTVKWINGLIILRLISGLLVVLFGLIVVLFPPESGFFSGVEGKLLELQLLIKGDVAQTLGLLVGAILMSFLFALITYYLLKYRKKVGFYIVVSLDIVIALFAMAIPLISIIVLILALQKQTRDYFDQNITQIN